jgi:hypothetical protein
VDRDGNIYVVPADGSFNADTGGKNYGDTVLKLRLGNNGLEVVNYFSPANHDCLDKTDLEIGSGGFTLLPSDAAAGRSLGMVVTKAGGLYLLDPRSRVSIP